MGEHRIVILAGDGEFSLPHAGSLGKGAEYVRAGSGYEAAAELLASPAVALVIDLSLLTERHRGLLRVARETGTDVLGVGELPAGCSAEDLRGVRLISPEDLPSILRTAAKKPADVRLAPAKPATYVSERRDSEAPHGVGREES